jgi:hypothetical protein
MLKKPEGLTKILKISCNLNESFFYEAMGFLRFKVITDINHLIVLEVMLTLCRKSQGSN